MDMVTDTVQSGAYSDMKIGNDGTIHISYWQRVEDKLVYAWRGPNDTLWHREYVEPTHQNGFRSSICLDTAGTPHIAYYENVSGPSRCSVCKTPWSIQLVGRKFA
jgi:hypothetical protein